MKLNISSLLENEYIDDGEGSLSGDSVPETSGMAVGTMQEYYGEYYLPINYQLTQEFNSGNYEKIGFSQYPILRGQTKLPDDRNLFGIPPEAGNLHRATIELTESHLADNGFVIDEDNSIAENKLPGAYTVYGYAQSKNGLYYPINSGSPLKFWFSKPSVKVTNTTDTTVTIKITSSEQSLSNVNFQAIGVTAKPFVQGAFELIDESGNILNYSETAIGFQSDDNSFILWLKDVPWNRTVKGYIYKRNFLGRHYLIGEFTATTKGEKLPQCELNTLWYDEPFSLRNDEVKGYIKSCPHISVSDYNAFCIDINAVRVKCDMSKYGSFVTVNAGDEMSHLVFEHLYYAIRAIYNRKGLEWDDSYPKGAPIQGNIQITKAFVEGLETALINARDIIYGG